MKKQLITIGISLLVVASMSIALISCGGRNNKTPEQQEHNSEDGHNHESTKKEKTHEYGGHEHGEGEEEHSHVQGEKVKTSSEYKGEKVKDLSMIIDNYIMVKNALIKDDRNGAAYASKELLLAFNGFDDTFLSGNQLKEYNEIKESAMENAQHIVKNPIDHQREHLVVLSQDIHDLIKMLGTDKKLYIDYCPMADNNNGAIWISEKEEINNPFMGSKMPKCGKIQSKIN